MTVPCWSNRPSRAAQITAAALLAASTVAAQGFKLSRPFPRRTVGQVDAFKVVPGSDRVVYLGDQEYTDELYSVRVDGSEEPIRLSDPLAPLGYQQSYVRSFAVTPDGNQVVFVRIDYTVFGQAELFAVPVTGGPLVRIAGPYPAGAFGQFIISPDSRQVVMFIPSTMYSVPIDGSAPPLLLGSRDVLYGYAIDPTSTHLVFVGRFNFPAEAFSVPLDRSTWPILLNSTPVNGGNVSGYFSISPSGGRVVLQGDLEVNDRMELFSAPIDASSPMVKLNDPLPAGGQVSVPFRSPGPIDYSSAFPIGAGDRVLYRADQEVDDRDELYSVPVDGSTPAIALNTGSVGDFQVDPTGARVVYEEAAELHSVPVDASAAPVPLSGSLVPGGAIKSFRFDPSGTRVVYAADQLVDQFVDLFSVPPSGGVAPAHLTADLPPHANLATYSISSDGSRVLYLADKQDDDHRELRSVPTDGSQPGITLNGELLQQALGGVEQFAISPRGGWVVYLANLFGVGKELHSVTFDEDHDLAPGKDVTNFQIAPDGGRVVFRTLFGLVFSVPIDGSQAPVLLTPPPLAPILYQVSPTSDRVLIVGELTDDVVELFSVPIDGSSPVIAISASVPNGDVINLPPEISPDGRHVVYRADHDTDEAFDLYSARVDGSAPPIRLTSLPSGKSVDAAQVTADSTGVVYNAPSGIGYRLYSVPIDGSLPSLNLTPSLAPGREVTSFDLTPDGQRALYLADQDTNNVPELYTVLVDGSTPPQELNAPLAAGDKVYGFEISPDGARAVYYLYRVRDIHSVPTDGSAPAVLLHPPLSAGWNVAVAEFSPSGDRVLYLGNFGTGVSELYVVPSDGSAAPLKLSGSLVSGGSVQSAYAVSPDGAWVVYLADAFVDERVELFSVPIDGSLAPRRENGPLIPLGDVYSFQIAPGSTRVVYVANQDGAAELFLSYLVPQDWRRRGSTPTATVTVTK